MSLLYFAMKTCDILAALIVGTPGGFTNVGFWLLLVGLLLFAVGGGLVGWVSLPNFFLSIIKELKIYKGLKLQLTFQIWTKKRKLNSFWKSKDTFKIKTFMKSCKNLSSNCWSNSHLILLPIWLIICQNQPVRSFLFSLSHFADRSSWTPFAQNCFWSSNWGN